MARRILPILSSSHGKTNAFFFSIALIAVDIVLIVLYVMLYNLPSNQYNIFNQLFGGG